MKTQKRFFTVGLMTAGLFVALLISGFSGKSSKPGNINLLQNKEQRQEAFNQIIQNHDLMVGFMNQMGRNPQAMNWMMQDSSFMDRLIFTDGIQ
jgi:polysaccharide deacetylase 2 family uncharacterized protein YibQ